MYVDAYALIVQQDGDGGDSLQREGMYAFGKWLRYNQKANILIVAEPPEHQDPKRVMDKFEVAPGIFVRHPDPNKWYSNPATTSRDQLVPVIAYCAAYADHARLWRLFKATVKRGLFAQNTRHAGAHAHASKIPDTMIGHLGLFIRAGGYWTAPLYPLLFITDTVNLIGTLLAAVPLHWEESHLRLRWREPRDVDDNNAVIAHLLAAHFKPTPISWLNRQVYASLRPTNNGNLVLGETNAVMGALAWYHRSEAGGNPEIAELYRPLIQEYFAPEETYSDTVARLRRGLGLLTDRILLSSNNF
jgi:hypothetical protein